MDIQEARALIERCSKRRPLVRIISERSRHCTRGWLVDVDNSGNATVKVFSHRGDMKFNVARLLPWKSANADQDGHKFVRPAWEAECRDHQALLDAMNRGVMRRQTSVKEQPAQAPQETSEEYQMSTATATKAKKTKKPFFKTVEKEWDVVKVCIEERLRVHLPKGQVDKIMDAMSGNPPYKPSPLFAVLARLDKDIVGAINGLLDTAATTGTWSVYRSTIGLVKTRKARSAEEDSNSGTATVVGVSRASALPKENLVELLKVNGLVECADSVSNGESCVCPEAYDISDEIAEQAGVYSIAIDGDDVKELLASLGVCKTSAIALLDSVKNGELSAQQVIEALLESHSKPQLVKIIANS